MIIYEDNKKNSFTPECGGFDIECTPIGDCPEGSDD